MGHCEKYGVKMLHGRRELGGVTPGLFGQRDCDLLELRGGEDRLDKESEREISGNG